MQIPTLSSKPEITEMFVITSHDFQVKMKYFFPSNFCSNLRGRLVRIVNFSKNIAFFKFLLYIIAGEYRFSLR